MMVFWRKVSNYYTCSSEGSVDPQHHGSVLIVLKHLHDRKSWDIWCSCVILDVLSLPHTPNAVKVFAWWQLSVNTVLCCFHNKLGTFCLLWWAVVPDNHVVCCSLWTPVAPSCTLAERNMLGVQNVNTRVKKCAKTIVLKLEFNEWP